MKLVFDRTQADVDEAKLIRTRYQTLGDWSGLTEAERAVLCRGTYNCADLNRVEAAVGELAELLSSAGYRVTVANRADSWEVSDKVRISDWTRIIANVQALRDAFYSLPHVPEVEPEEKLHFSGANAIEYLLHELDRMIAVMITSYRKCGTVKAGENKIQMPFERTVV